MSDLIRTARKRAGLTGGRLGERLGITAGAVSRMERSEREGTIQLDTLRRALDAMGRNLQLDAQPDSPYAGFTPASVTDEINRAIDADEPETALRMLTHALSMLTQHRDRFTQADLERRPSEIGDPRWEQLFRALYADALPGRQRPSWAEPERLDRRWYVFGDYESLRRRAQETTPEGLRKLNIMLDERSLTRA